ncbi:MAG: hypothetical protein ABFS45_07565 [Pseudomonadota bacterium]
MNKRTANRKQNKGKVKRILGELTGYTKRGSTERRGWKPLPPLPFFDSSGIPVTEDRRKPSDRRENDLAVKLEEKRCSK